MTWPYYLTLILGRVEADQDAEPPVERDPYQQAALEQDFMSVLLNGPVREDPA